jgi:hypothetical protein
MFAHGLFFASSKLVNGVVMTVSGKKTFADYGSPDSLFGEPPYYSYVLRRLWIYLSGAGGAGGGGLVFAGEGGRGGAWTGVIEYDADLDHIFYIGEGGKSTTTPTGGLGGENANAFYNGANASGGTPMSLGGGGGGSGTAFFRNGGEIEFVGGGGGGGGRSIAPTNGGAGGAGGSESGGTGGVGGTPTTDGGVGQNASDELLGGLGGDQGENGQDGYVSIQFKYLL